MGFYRNNVSERSFEGPETPLKNTTPCLPEFTEEISLLQDIGSDPEVLQVLIEASAETALLHALQSEDSTTSELAVVGLLECWANEAGKRASGELRRAHRAIENLDLELAESCLLSLIHFHPNWSEPICALAELRYLQDRLEESVVLHHRAIELRPHHFGAWHSLALVALELKSYDLARHAIGCSRTLRPFHDASQVLELHLASMA